ncbi:MAG TPA: PEP-CTERM system TPR-repeat protein PrsT, partial [Nitrospirae bacterium]|nr:PEP-CTERM system TPR-repeat protein PrsT [Nitrospirota bacterium]
MDTCMNKLLLVIILLTGTGLLYGCSDVTDDQYLANAQKYIDSGKMKAALIEMKNLLRNNPDNPKGRLMMGRLQFETGNMAAAEKELTKARELGVEDALILPLLAQALLLQGKGDEVLKLPLKNLTASGQGEILAAQGQVKLTRGELSEAASLIEKAVSKNPASINALIASARVHAAKKELALARDKLEAAFLIDPKSASAWSLLGNIEWQEQNLDLAEKAYSKAIEYRKNNFADHFKRALVRIQLNKYDEAQQDVGSIKKSYPQHAGTNYAQGLIFYHNKNFRDAAASFEIAISDEGRYPLALLYLGASYFLQNNPEQAETFAKRFVYLSPDNIDGRKLLAVIMYKKKEYSEVEKLIRPVTDARKDDINALNILTGALIKQGKMDEAIDLLARLAALQPDSPEAQTRLGAGLLAGGKQDSGVEHLESAIQLKPDNKQANALLILSYLQKKDYDAALKAANTFRERNPGNAVSYNLLGRVYLATKQEKKAQEVFFKAGKLEPGDPYAYRGLALLALKDKDFDKASGYYQEILKYHENHLPTLLSLAIVDGLKKDEKSMVARLQQAISAHPNAINPRLMLARYYLARGKPDKAAFLVNALDDEIQKNSPAAL